MIFARSVRIAPSDCFNGLPRSSLNRGRIRTPYAHILKADIGGYLVKYRLRDKLTLHAKNRKASAFLVCRASTAPKRVSVP